MNNIFRILDPVALISSTPLFGAADMPLGGGISGGDPFAGAAARTVKAIVDYTAGRRKRAF